MNKSTCPTYLVTHTTPDWDAICATWLLKHFEPNLASARIVFVGANAPMDETLSNATAVLDVGLEYEPARMRFDHHMGELGKNTCAAKQVYQYLCEKHHDKKTQLALRSLAPLIELIFKVDTGRRDAFTEESHTTGIHALLAGERQRVKSASTPDHWDQLVLRYGCELLNNLASTLLWKLKSREDPQGEVVYRSTDGKVCAIRHGSQEPLFEAGAILVIYEGTPLVTQEGEQTYPIGVSRAHGLHEPNVGSLITNILHSHPEIDSELRREMGSWWSHPSGFMSGRGSAKAPRKETIKVSIIDIAKFVDAAWIR